MSEYMNNQPRELNWDDTISHEDVELPCLPDGDYPFQIVSIEKTRHQPRDGGKLPPCNKAILTVRVRDRKTGMQADFRHNLFLHTSMEWRLCEFFAAIGQRQKGEALRMDWRRVVGSTGLCKVKRRERRDGRPESEIDRFYPAYDLPGGSQAAPIYSQPQQGYAAPQQPESGFIPGRF